MAGAELKRFKVVCPHDCPDTCVATVDVNADGRAVAIGGDPSHSFTQGFLCAKVNHYLDRVYSPDRILHPMKRVGTKGAGKFERITWSEALETIAGRFRSIIETDGAEAILPYSYAGNSGLLSYGSLDRRFFATIGASKLDRTICASAGFEGYTAVYGATIGLDPEEIGRAKLIVAWGANIVTSNVHLWPFIAEAKKRGSRLVVIDPFRSRTAEHADEHIAPRPGTDGALALAVMHVLFRDGLIDDDYIARYTTGVEGLRERATPWTPARAAEETGVAADVIEAFGREYGTTRPAAIRVNYGLNRSAGGGNTIRLIACLPSLTGDWRHVGGGIQLSSSGAYPTNPAALERRDTVDPRARTINMTELGRVLNAEDLKPRVLALFVYNANPAAVAPDQNAVLRGLAREDLFVVVHDLFATDTADYADIVLPATTVLEHTDILKSYGHLRIALNRPAIAPLGEAVSNTELFRRLARAMGLTDPMLHIADDELLKDAFDWNHPRMKGITVDLLERETHARLNVPEAWAPFANGGFPTPSGRAEFRSSREEAKGEDPWPRYVPPRESEARDPGRARRYPLSFISPPTHHFLNSTFASQPVFLRRESEPGLTIHPEDAKGRGIADGARVEVFNDRGMFQATARVSDAARPGVVVGLSIWWAKLCPGGRNANAVTSQALTDMGGGATFYDTLVDVRVAPLSSGGRPAA
jgi:anaerobic selenocysteine-containing dehydrogenase